MLITIIILSSLLIVAMIAILNLIFQVEGLEELILTQEGIMNDIRQRVLQTQVQLKEVDLRGSFESDDEVGFVFKQIQEINNELLNSVDKNYGNRNN